MLHNPYIWHFAMHSIPELPETLNVLSVRPEAITDAARAEYAKGYADDSALTAGFDWYRAFPVDAEENARSAGRPVSTPVLYLRGEGESGDIDTYVEGLRAAGLANLRHALIADAGHFPQEESPDHTWRAIREFAGFARR